MLHKMDTSSASQALGVQPWAARWLYCLPHYLACREPCLAKCCLHLPLSAATLVLQRMSTPEQHLSPQRCSPCSSDVVCLCIKHSTFFVQVALPTKWNWLGALWPLWPSSVTPAAPAQHPLTAGGYG